MAKLCEELRWTYRRAGLGYLVRPASRFPWRPPSVRGNYDPGPGLTMPDPLTLQRVLDGLKQL